MDDSILGLIVMAVLFGPPMVIGYGIGSWRRGRKEQGRTNLAISSSQLAHSTIEEIRHVAYEQMAVDPSATLPPIVVDVIREYDNERNRAMKALGTNAPTYEPERAAGSPFMQLHVTRTSEQPPTNQDG